MDDISDEALEDLLSTLQLQAASLAGFQDPEEGLLALRAALSLFPDDHELHSIPIYRQFNRSQQGSLSTGSTIPATPCFTEAALETTVTDLLANAPRPVLLVAGSGS
eukprot:TRINITY_DN20052_c0_g1_i1.p3 TRINITY_DN20052_c0_g1~~TRINITY_DN20052_c0_g1_i1.p3  ORF type:complete len:107 (+),score=28.56 TRINITY_DN20052_c0_g1_i1:337-657(+)